jgi:hypothetical protein
MLQKAGGTFTLTAEVDFGATYGLKTAYYKSRATNPSGAGIIRLGNTELVAWRNAANSGNLSLGVNASDQFLFTGGPLVPDTTNLYDLGTTGVRWKDLYLSGNAVITGDATITGNVAITGTLSSGAYSVTNLTATGNTVLGDNVAVDTLTLNSALASDIVPAASNLRDIGSSLLLFKDGYFAGNLNAAAFIPSGSTIPTNGLFLSAANTPAIAANSTTRMTFGSTILATANFRPSVTATYDIGSTALRWANISGVSADFSGNVVSGRFTVTDSTIPANGMYLPSANTLGFATNTTLYGSISSSGLWTIGASGGTQAHAVNGRLDVTQRVNINVANSSGVALRVSPSSLTSGADQIALQITGTFASDALSSASAFSASATTVAASFTLPLLAQYSANNPALGAGSTVTRRVGYYGNAQTGGANNAFIADNASFTGDWFINSTDTNPSKFSGLVTVAGVVVNNTTVPANGIYLPSANTLGFATNTTLQGSISSAGAWTIGASGGTQAHVINGSVLTLGGADANAILLVAPSGATRNAQLTLRTAASSSGDSSILFEELSGNQWHIGRDDSDASAWVVSQSGSLGTNNAIRVDLTTRVVECPNGLRTKVSTANVSNPPTDAELDSTFGTPATVGSGFVGLVNDNGGGTNEYLCWSDGTNWFYSTGTKAA